MPRNAFISCLFLFSTLLIAGCSALSKDWPKLSDPIPGEKDRVRVTESIVSATPPLTPVPATLLSEAEARALLTSVEAGLKTASSAYQKSLNAFMTSKDTADRKALWREAQLMLTRLSRELDQLDAILYNDSLKGSAPWQAAKTLLTKTEADIAAEGQKLSGLMPQ